MNFIHHTGLEQARVDLSASLAQQPPHLPLFTQPPESGDEVEVLVTEGLYFVGYRCEFAQVLLGGSTRSKHDDGREAAFKNRRLGIQGSRSANNDAQVVFGQAVFEAQTPVHCGAGPQADWHQVHRSGTGHNGISPGPQFEQKRLVAFAAEGLEFACSGSELAVSGCSDIDKNERQPLHLRKITRNSEGCQIIARGQPGLRIV